MTSPERAARSAKTKETLEEELQRMRLETAAMEAARNQMGTESGTESTQMHTEENEEKTVPQEKTLSEEDMKNMEMHTEENKEKPDPQEKTLSDEEKKNMGKNASGRLQKELDEMKKGLPEHLRVMMETEMMKKQCWCSFSASLLSSCSWSHYRAFGAPV